MNIKTMKQNSLYIGIDPEQNGGLSYIYHPENSLTPLEIKMFNTSPNEEERANLLLDILDKFPLVERINVTIEKIWVAKGWSSKTGHAFSTSFGMWIGLVSGAIRASFEIGEIDFSINTVPSRTWQKAIIGETTSDKEDHVKAVKRLFEDYPTVMEGIQLDYGLTKKNIYDRVDSLLIGFYGYKIIDGNEWS